MLEAIKEHIRGKSIAVAGFGLEGQSTFRFLRQHLGNIPLAVADRDPAIAAKTDIDLGDPEVTLFSGESYLDRLSGFDIVFKSPGLSVPDAFRRKNPGTVITSQTALVLAEFHRQIIGITGTKGKSTTSSLIHHIMQSSGRQSILIGNIGAPPFDSLHLVRPETFIICELSSHQLEDVRHSPHIGVLLNLFPEHLDRYASLAEYFTAKWNIFSYQQEGDILILNDSIDPVHLPKSNLIKGKTLKYGTEEGIPDGCYLKGDKVIIRDAGKEQECCTLDESLFLKGRHNRLNMMAGILACRESGISFEEIMRAIRTFQGLEHRLEYAGCHAGIHFYNDSIATIPEATMEAVQTLKDIDTLILGGYDRMLDYTELIEFLMSSGIRNLIFMGKAGERMMKIAGAHCRNSQHHLFSASSLQDAFEIILRETRPGSICLLSPAAASYGMYKNFEERGRLFKKIAGSL